MARKKITMRQKRIILQQLMDGTFPAQSWSVSFAQGRLYRFNFRSDLPYIFWGTIPASRRQR
jgi:hypothetical protein